MSVTSNRSIAITQIGDVEYSQSFNAAVNAAGPGQNQVVSLSTGNNTITVPEESVAVTMIFADDNSVQVTLKGANGDTGIALNLTDPSSVGLNEVDSFVLSAASAVTVRLIFS